ncbi:hypothetical protein E8E14_009745 [Neopestalotiopsis sp. 37M]|nr:hypothetical protein E8E14_009745 [Neopestalotiopsis sp. 37M]
MAYANVYQKEAVTPVALGVGEREDNAQSWAQNDGKAKLAAALRELKTAVLTSAKVHVDDEIHLETYESIARHERDRKKPILMTGDFIATRISFPEWPQVPQGTVRSNTGNPRLYCINLWGTPVTIPVKHLRTEKDHQVFSAEDIREYRAIAHQKPR